MQQRQTESLLRAHGSACVRVCKGVCRERRGKIDRRCRSAPASRPSRPPPPPLYSPPLFSRQVRARARHKTKHTYTLVQAHRLERRRGNTRLYIYALAECGRDIASRWYARCQSLTRLPRLDVSAAAAAALLVFGQQSTRTRARGSVNDYAERAKESERRREKREHAPFSTATAAVAAADSLQSASAAL